MRRASGVLSPLTVAYKDWRPNLPSNPEGWLYLVVVLDLFSRKVVGWSMSVRASRHAEKRDHSTTHFRGVNRKLRVANRTQAVLQALRLGIFRQSL